MPTYSTLNLLLGSNISRLKISVGVTKNSKADAQVSISGPSFTLVSSAGKDYGYSMTVAPDPSLSAKLYVGATDSGWVVFQVKKDDLKPVLTFEENMMAQAEFGSRHTKTILQKIKARALTAWAFFCILN